MSRRFHVIAALIFVMGGGAVVLTIAGESPAAAYVGGVAIGVTVTGWSLEIE